MVLKFNIPINNTNLFTKSTDETTLSFITPTDRSVKQPDELRYLKIIAYIFCACVLISLMTISYFCYYTKKRHAASSQGQTNESRSSTVRGNSETSAASYLIQLQTFDSQGHRILPKRESSKTFSTISGSSSISTASNQRDSWSELSVR